MSRRASLPLALALLLTGAGCGGDDSPRDRQDANTLTDTRVAADTRPATDTRPAPLDVTVQDSAGPVDTSSPTGCTRTGWTPSGSMLGQLAEGETAGAYDTLFVDSYSDDEAVPYDLLGLELYFDMGADTGPHSFAFSGENYAECHTCLLVYAGCDDDFNCTKTFLASAGRVEVTATGGPGDTFHAGLRDVVLDEVSIDDETFESAPVAGGERWCIPSFTYDTELVVFE